MLYDITGQLVFPDKKETQFKPKKSQSMCAISPLQHIIVLAKRGMQTTPPIPAHHPAIFPSRI